VRRAAHTTAFESPAFIVGVPRSGTTLLAAILSRHPDVCVTSETHFFRLLHQYPGGWERLVRGWPTTAVAFLKDLHHFHLLNVDAEEIIAKLNGPCETPGELFLSLGNAYAEKCGKKYWIEKTPDHLLHLAAIRGCFPGSKIIHILRDGRDVALSLSKVPWANDGFLQNVYRWSHELDAASFFFAADKAFVMIRYEDLISSPEETVRKVCDFLGIDFARTMLTPDGSENRLIEKGRLWKENVEKPIDGRNQGKWRKESSQGLQQASAMLFGAALRRWGYAASPLRDSRPTVRLARSLCVSDYSYHTRPMPLSDAVLEALVDAGYGLTLEERDVYSAVRGPEDALWILEDRFPIGSQGHADMVKFYLRMQLNFAWRWRGIKLVWFYHGDAAKTRSWSFRWKMERSLAGRSSAIVCKCQTSENCQTAAALGVSEEKVLHPTAPEFVTKLVSLAVQAAKA
jgi:hypothetical protein